MLCLSKVGQPQRNMLTFYSIKMTLTHVFVSFHRCMRDEDQSNLLRDGPSLSSISGENLSQGKERVYKKPVYKLGRLSVLQGGERGSRCNAGGDLGESPRISQSCSSKLVPSGLDVSKRSSEEKRKFSKRQTSGGSSCDGLRKSDQKPERYNLKRRSEPDLESTSSHPQKKRAGGSTRHSPRQQPGAYRKSDSPGADAYRPAFQGREGPELSGSSRDKTPCSKPWQPIRFKIQKTTNLVQGSRVTCEQPLSRHKNKGVKTSTGALESECPPYTDRTVAKHALLGVKDAVKTLPKASPSSKGGRKGSPPRPEVPERARNTDSLVGVAEILPVLCSQAFLHIWLLFTFWNHFALCNHLSHVFIHMSIFHVPCCRKKVPEFFLGPLQPPAMIRRYQR